MGRRGFAKSLLGSNPDGALIRSLVWIFMTNGRCRWPTVLGWAVYWDMSVDVKCDLLGHVAKEPASLPLDLNPWLQKTLLLPSPNYSLTYRRDKVDMSCPKFSFSKQTQLRSPKLPNARPRLFWEMEGSGYVICIQDM